MNDELLDITAPESVDVEIRSDGKVVWIHVNGITRMRLCRVGNLTITDGRVNCQNHAAENLVPIFGPGETTYGPLTKWVCDDCGRPLNRPNADA